MTTVALLPPITGGGPNRPDGATPLTTGPRYIRTVGMGRWHRPRSGYTDVRGSTYSLWCGPFIRTYATDRTPAGLAVDDVPDGESVCGTCVGRALGAGQDETPVGLARLRFDPRWIKPPALCPGSRNHKLWTSANRLGNIGTCMACGDPVRILTIGRGYSAYGAGPIKHPPGEGLVQPCPWHAWQHVVRRDDRAVCHCGWHEEEVS